VTKDLYEGACLCGCGAHLTLFDAWDQVFFEVRHEHQMLGVLLSRDEVVALAGQLQAWLARGAQEE
jgi:hypothetical protein